MPLRTASNTHLIIFAIGLLFIGLTGCTVAPSTSSIESITPSKTNTQPPSPTSTTARPTSTSTVTPSPTLTDTPTLTPTKAPTNTNTPTSTLTLTPDFSSVDNQIYIYFVHLNTGGPVACGDSLVPLSIGYVRTGDIKQDITIALNSLFSAGQYSGALYNATYTSNLHVDKVDFNKFSGEAIIYTSGSFTKPETNCDKSRYRAQAFTTARQFPEVTRAIIWVGSKLLGDLLVAAP